MYRFWAGDAKPGGIRRYRITQIGTARMGAGKGWGKAVSDAIR